MRVKRKAGGDAACGAPCFERAECARSTTDSQRCLDRRGRQSKLEGRDRAGRDERQRGHERRPTELQDPAEAFLPGADRRDDAPQTPGEVHDQPAGELDRLRPRDGCGLDDLIGAQRRRDRHHRQNLSRRPQFHEITSEIGPAC